MTKTISGCGSDGMARKLKAKETYEKTPKQKAACPGWDGRACGMVGAESYVGRRWSVFCETCDEKFIAAISQWKARKALESGTLPF